MKKNFDFFAIRTPLIQPPKEDIFPIINNYVSDLQDGDILFITTKILSIHQGNCVKAESANKDELAKKVASHFIERDQTTPYPSLITIVNGCLMPSAGIDQSNANGYLILWPTNIDDLLLEIRSFLMKKFCINNLGIIATDTRSNLLQIGTSGMVVACCGFQPIYSYIESEDLFNRPFTTTKINIAQSLSSMAVLIMGEGNEQTPMAIYRNCENKNGIGSKIIYTNAATTKNAVCAPEEDMFLPLLRPLLKTEKDYSNKKQTINDKKK